MAFNLKVRLSVSDIACFKQCSNHFIQSKSLHDALVEQVVKEFKEKQSGKR